MRRRRSTFAVAVLAVAALLTGCAGIPMSGPVQTGLPDLEQVDQAWQYIAAGPSPGASQKDIVHGFVEAASASTDDYSVAREFLTPEYAGQWDPHYSVLIDDGNRPYRENGEDAGIMELSAVAKVDARGSMLPVEPGPKTQWPFEFEQVGGEWRIASAPAGVVLDAATFTSIWSPRQLYFVGPGEMLVPDTRWFLNRSSLPTAIVGALLEGPAEWLRGAVHSGFASGTTLVTNSVPVENGRARIDLSGALLDGNEASLAEAYQQVTMSLQSVADVNSFEIFVEGVPLQEVDDTDMPSAPAEIFDPTVLLRDGSFGTFVGGRFEVSGGYTEQIAGYEPNAVAVSPVGEAVALRTRSEIRRIDPDSNVIVDERPALLEPGFDVFGQLWTASAREPAELLVTGPEGTSETLAAPMLAKRKVLAVRVSPEGARIAALVADKTGSQVLVAGIVRDPDGTPTALTEESNVQMWAPGGPIDLDWMGQQGFVVLSKGDAGSRVTAGGPGRFSVTQAATVPDGVQVTGGGARAQLRVRGSDGALFSSQGSGWQRSEADVSVLAKVG